MADISTLVINFPNQIQVPGVTDHGELNGLTDDDHPQYHNNARGDARYSPLGHTHTAIASLDVTTLRIALGSGQFLRLVPVLDSVTGTWSLDPRVET